jgi:hypothetical protein
MSSTALTVVSIAVLVAALVVALRAVEHARPPMSYVPGCTVRSK